MPSRSPRAGAIRPGSLVHEGPGTASRHGRAESPGANGRSGRRPSWWSWPSLLAVDAPIVGVAWLLAFGAHAGQPVTVSAALVVGLAIWLAYVADRLADIHRMTATGAVAGAARDSTGRPTDGAARVVPANHLTPRHAFARKTRTPLTAAWAIALAAAVALALETFATPALLAGCAVAAVATTTLGTRIRASVGGATVRAMLVGAAFSGAMAVGLGWNVPSDLVPGIAAFGLACAANVAFIGRWERHLPDGADGPPPPAFAGLGLAGAAFVVAAPMALTGGGIVAPALAASALALACLHAAHARLAPDLARALADAALVLPLGILALAGSVCCR